MKSLSHDVDTSARVHTSKRTVSHTPTPLSMPEMEEGIDCACAKVQKSVNVIENQVRSNLPTFSVRRISTFSFILNFSECTCTCTLSVGHLKVTSLPICTHFKHDMHYRCYGNTNCDDQSVNTTSIQSLMSNFPSFIENAQRQ